MSYVNLGYPVLTPCPATLSESLREALNEYHQLFPASRTKIEAWEGKWWSIWTDNEDTVCSSFSFNRSLGTF